MQQIQAHFRWFRAFRMLRISALLVMALFLFATANATIFLLAQKPQDVQAQTIPALVDSKEVTEPAKAANIAQAAATSPAPQAAVQQPQPAAPAPKPVPAYDKVSIPSIGLSSRFVTVGLTSANAIDVHPSLVGWWNGSSQPGTPGAVFLDGHNPRVLSKLPSLKEGAQISLTKADGQSFTYTVVHIETVMLAGINMRAALSPYSGASEGLNLMTCVGTYNAKTGTTDQRLVVYAVRS